MLDLDMAYLQGSELLSYFTVGVILPKSGGYDVTVFSPEHSAFFRWTLGYLFGMFSS
jgi:hypothetical protein